MPERSINQVIVNLSDQQSDLIDFLSGKPEGVSMRELLIFVCSSQNKQILQSNLTVNLAKLSEYLANNGLEDVIQITKEDTDRSNSKIINIKLNPDITIG
jgi:hypothetical protein